MIVRIWHGWTTRENADAYERLLNEEVFNGIEKREISGFLGIELLRRDVETEIEFVTIMRFKSIYDVREFAGRNYETAVVPEAARQLLKRFDQTWQHFELRPKQ